jgi:hypothetical protein
LCNETQEPARRTASPVFGRIYLIVVEWVKTAGARFKERTLAREAELSPLLEAVARERLMTQKAGKCLAGAVVNCGD